MSNKDGLRWKQGQPLRPTADADSLGICGGYANALLTMDSNLLMPFYSCGIRPELIDVLIGLFSNHQTCGDGAGPSRMWVEVEARPIIENSI